MTPTFRLPKAILREEKNERDKAARRTTRGSSTERRRGNKTRVSGNLSRGSSIAKTERGKLRKREKKEED